MNILCFLDPLNISKYINAEWKFSTNGSRFESDDIFDYPKDTLEANSDDSSTGNNNYFGGDISLRDFSEDWFVHVGVQALELVQYMESHNINSLTEAQIQRLLNNLNHVLGQVKKDKNGNLYLKGKWRGIDNSVSQDDILKLRKFKEDLESRL